MSNKFIILGIHDENVYEVMNNVARVRMYVGNKEIDEDFTLPILPDESGVPKNEQTYRFFLAKDIEARMIELMNKKDDAATSKVESLEKTQLEQVITDKGGKNE